MSSEQYAFLNKQRVPSREAWQSSIDSSGFDFQLDPELRPFEDSGFLPCKLMGTDAGFEIDYDDSPELLAEFGNLADGRDCCIVFRWGGSMIECASVLIACYSLAKDFDAIVSYEGEDPPESLAMLLDETRACIEEARKEF